MHADEMQRIMRDTARQQYAAQTQQKGLPSGMNQHQQSGTGRQVRFQGAPKTQMLQGASTREYQET